MSFTFQTDDKSRAFCERILEAMNLLFDIDPSRGVELLNQYWRGKDWRDPSAGGGSAYAWLIYHESPAEWAERIGNPHPYEKGPALEAWESRRDEAERRLAELRKTRSYPWL
jgi:hypothetical protein